MGMTCSLRRVSEDEIRRLLESPDEVADFLLGDETPPPSPRRRGLLGFLLRLTPISIEDPGERTPPDRPAHDEIDIDKAWHGLHFLFTRTAWEGDLPAAFLLCGGDELGGGEEIGQGPPRAHRPEAVQRIAEFLAHLSREELERRFDPARMKQLEIYPDVIWTRPAAPGDSPLEYLLANFDSLKIFLAGVAARGDGVIVYLT
jgi:hypothetical protein